MRKFDNNTLLISTSTSLSTYELLKRISNIVYRNSLANINDLLLVMRKETIVPFWITQTKKVWKHQEVSEACCLCHPFSPDGIGSEAGRTSLCREQVSWRAQAVPITTTHIYSPYHTGVLQSSQALNSVCRPA